MLATLIASAVLAAAPFPETIPVPVGSSPEGIATGKGTTFYVGSRDRNSVAPGSVYKGDLRTGEGEILVPSQPGRESYGLKARGGKLYVAGGPTGFAYVYDARTGANVDAVDFDGGFVNDVTVTRGEGVLHRLAQAARLRLRPPQPGRPRRCRSAASTCTRPGSTPTASRRRRTASA